MQIDSTRIDFLTEAIACADAARRLEAWYARLGLTRRARAMRRQADDLDGFVFVQRAARSVQAARALFAKVGSGGGEGC